MNGKALNTFFDTFDQQSRRCVECLEERVDTGEFDIIHYMDNCTLDIILGELIVGFLVTINRGCLQPICSREHNGNTWQRSRWWIQRPDDMFGEVCN